ncbi:MAG: hypothetical protein H6510_02920 [Acidobacteria bacterium]|nr:hypothetical protein [Acidobacteriota bacterium]
MYFWFMSSFLGWGLIAIFEMRIDWWPFVFYLGMTILLAAQKAYPHFNRPWTVSVKADQFWCQQGDIVFTESLSELKKVVQYPLGLQLNWIDQSVFVPAVMPHYADFWVEINSVLPIEKLNVKRPPWKGFFVFVIIGLGFIFVQSPYLLIPIALFLSWASWFAFGQESRTWRKLAMYMTFLLVLTYRIVKSLNG